MNSDNSERALRAQAEAWLAGAPPDTRPPRNSEALVNELRVCEVELVLTREALRQSQLALEQARGRYGELYEQSPVGYLTLTRGGRIAEANVSVATLLGMARKDLLDLDFERFVGAPGRERWQRHFREILDQGGPQVFELALVGGGAAPFSHQVQVHGRRVPTDAGPTLGLALIDVSGRQATEDLLRKLSLAVEQSPESIVITNLAGEIEYVNEAFVRIAGYAREALIGRNMSLLQSGRTPRQTYRELWDALGQGQPWRGRFINRREDGSEYVESAIITPLRQADGRVTHYVAVKADLTGHERRQSVPPTGCAEAASGFGA